MAGHWLDHYGSQKYRWQTRPDGSRTMYYRPMGIVERAFDSDGRYYEGRADINTELMLEAKTTMATEQLRERILLTWTAHRCRHLLLQAATRHCTEVGEREVSPIIDEYFTVSLPSSVEEAVEEAREQLVFLDDHYPNAEPTDFWMHSQNTARVIKPEISLARLYVHPIKFQSDGKFDLRLLWIMGHQIADGLACFAWHRNFIHTFNKSNREIRGMIASSLKRDTVLKELPLPQEALYPPITGSRARQRWFWLLTRILRHVRKPLPAGFPNPLHRPGDPQQSSITLSPTYASLLDYSRGPPLQSIRTSGDAGASSTARLHRICREANVSIGAGCFALAALLMMEFHEALHPGILLHERRPFIAGFPLNPRAFFNHTVDPNCLMLAFCDGIAMPFLPSDLDLDGRLRLLARQAHRQLAIFQKRKSKTIVPDEKGLQYMGSRGAGRLLALQYLQSVERMGSKMPEDLRESKAGGRSVYDVQGDYPARPNGSMQTCGVSSIGRIDHIISSGMYDIDVDFDEVGQSLDGCLVADYRGLRASVRPRDGEFLIGSSGSSDALNFSASVDLNATDPKMVEKWNRRFETILREPGGDRREHQVTAKL